MEILSWIHPPNLLSRKKITLASHKLQKVEMTVSSKVIKMVDVAQKCKKYRSSLFSLQKYFQKLFHEYNHTMYGTCTKNSVQFDWRKNYFTRKSFARIVTRRTKKRIAVSQ